MMDQIFQNDVNENNSDIISIDQLVTQNNQVESTEVLSNQLTPSNNTSTIVNEAKKVEQSSVDSQSIPKKKDKILTIQITLIIVWAILTALVYFFGYDLLEPFIKV